jgi:Plant transposon protein
MLSWVTTGNSEPRQILFCYVRFIISCVNRYTNQRWLVYRLTQLIINLTYLATLTDKAKRNICPIEIKLLAVLRILGRNWNFDDIAEATLMFCQGVLLKIMGVFEQIGLPGCIGSSDCVHLKWDRCPIDIAQLCSGKEGYPTLAYSCTVDHRRRILASTSSYWGAKNDKTIVRGDTYITDVKFKKVHSETRFDIYVNRSLKSVRVCIICAMVVITNGHA